MTAKTAHTVTPYRRPPQPPVMALLTRSGAAGAAYVVVDEHGEQHSLDALPERVRVWGSYDVLHDLTNEGVGEALCWRNEVIRWRHRPFEEGWRQRPTDVHVLRLPFDDEPGTTAEVLHGLARWRDWLASHRAAPVGTTGACAWSLLRAKLSETLWCTAGDPPPLLQTLGGRQELGPAGAGSFTGELEQADLQAAYASTLGRLAYGGHWWRASQLASRNPEAWARDERPVFVRCRVRIPRDLVTGPLPRRPRGRQTPLEAALLGASYPTGTTMQGVWTWQEVKTAERFGARILRIDELWVHLAHTQPFLPWWDAIVEGRRMRGWAGVLAKMTGNALWGRFAMDNRTGAVRAIRSRNGARGRMTQRPLPFKGGQRPTHDLAETVSGRVRARLYEAMLLAGGRLISAHTDGLWQIHERGERLPDGWRVKEQASHLDVLDPQVLRYRPRGRHSNDGEGGAWRHVFAGVPAGHAEEAFTEAWRREGFEDMQATEGMRP